MWKLHTSNTIDITVVTCYTCVQAQNGQVGEMAMNIRAVGDFRSDDDYDGGGLHALLSQCDLSRKLYLYIRKSNKTGIEQNANYLIAQESLVTHLIDAGVSPEKMVALEDDTGKSGALSRKFRKDLDALFEAIGEGGVGTVVAIDIARLFRDYTDIEPATFAARMGRHKVSVLTTDDGKWLRLQMEEENAKERFKALAKAAAKDRKTIRARTMYSKEQSVLNGNYSGSPVPVGWAVKPGLSKHESDDGIAHAPRMYVYEPHRKIKLEIMQASLLPHIQSYPALYRHLKLHGIAIPPFAPEVGKESFSRSCLCKVWSKEVGGRRYLKRDEPCLPSIYMLPSLLLEPLAIGDRMYGSGRSGYYKMLKAEHMAAMMDRQSDTRVRPGKAYIGNAPELAVCRTQEEIELYWKVVAKWSKIDIKAAKELGYKVQPKNERRTAGIASPGRPRGATITNAWAGKVFCLKHGMDDNGNPSLLRNMRLVGNNGVWACAKDHIEGKSEHLCSSWGLDNRLGKILDFHLFYNIHAWLASNHQFLQDVSVEHKQAKQRAGELRKEIGALEDERDRQLKRQDDLERRMQGMDEDFVRTQADAFFDANIRPIMISLSKLNKELVWAEAASVAGTADQLEEDFRADLQAVIDTDNLPVSKKRDLIELFVDHIGILVGDGIDAREAIIVFKWAGISDGSGKPITDVLVSWRGPWKDTRPWTPEEDTAIRELWPAQKPESGEQWFGEQSTDDYLKIKRRLQKGRKFSNIRRRAITLGVADGSRSKAWQSACAELDSSWGDKNPEVLYLIAGADVPTLAKHATELGQEGELLPSDNKGVPIECDAVVLSEGISTQIPIPEEVLSGVQLLLAKYPSRSRPTQLFHAARTSEAVGS